MKKISLVLISSFFLFCMASYSQSNIGDTIKIIERELKVTINTDSLDSTYVSVTREVVNSQSDSIVEKESAHAESESKGSHGGGQGPLFFIIISLLIGSVVRHFFRKVPIPFTVLLLIIGFLLGLVNRLGAFEGWGATFSNSLLWASHIDPHAILFIFLPILIFEAAFAMDIHTFKKTATNAVILAVPGIIIALVLSAGLAILLKIMGVGLYSWEWNIALMFGAVISATDPVAVVALLKELGASKKLSTLIEGESLLNDGTAIVIFMVFFTGITGTTGDTNAIVEFGRVAFGGILLGIIIGGVAIAWVKRVFNDALVEISVIVVGAYLAFFVAEHFLQISGVLALVSLGLVMAGVGKTRISPKVEHFLHNFWELAAFLANTLIFIIVGVIISQRSEFSAKDFIILGIFYIGIHVIRAIMLIVLYPIMKRIGYGLNLKETTVIWYGALRGAIALALALLVLGVDDKYINPEIKNQFFFFTAGIVTLSLIINATTIKLLVDKLGLTKIAPAKALMIKNANSYLRTSTENAIERLKTEKFMSNADWSVVESYLPKEKISKEVHQLEIEAIAEMRKRVLEKEKSSYWSQFNEGMIGGVAASRLSSGIDELLDDVGLISISQRKDLELLLNTPKLLSKMQNYSLLKTLTQRAFFERLVVSYDSAMGFVQAQEECLKLVESMFRSLDVNDTDGQKHLAMIEDEINENKIEGLTFLRNLKKTYPEIYDAISTRLAIRSMLNYELKTIERLQKNGRIDAGESSKMIHSVEERLKKLTLSPPKVKVPEPIDLLAEIKWLKNVDESVLTKIANICVPKVYTVGTRIIKENTNEDGIYFICRGTVKVSVNDEVIDILGHGTIVGEISLITGKSRTATITAESPVKTLFLSNHDMKQIMEDYPKIADKLMYFAGARIAELKLRKTEPFSVWRQKDFFKWLEKGHIELFEKGDEFVPKGFAVILSGELIDKSLSLPCLVQKTVEFSKKGFVFICPEIK